MTDDSLPTQEPARRSRMPPALFFVIFAVSGFSGLIYESIWSHYLKLFLGHAAYAQSLVLIIFMGGMALGAWLTSRFSSRSRSLLFWYAVIELAVGLAALAFHSIFANLMELFYASVLPNVGSPTVGALLKWSAASLLIMPQSILLGMTFPLMSAGIMRLFPSAEGRSISTLYFSNSLGAAIGVLVSGFWLIGLKGLPGTMAFAGMLNVALAVFVFFILLVNNSAPSRPPAKSPRLVADRNLAKLLLLAAFITGLASFIYEVSWIRLLTLVLGATTHSFELMLSAFIFGLAFGGLWIRNRIDSIADPIRFAGVVQLIMGLLALLTIPIYTQSFGWMEWLLQALDNNETSYAAYSVASHGIALAIMLPVTFMAGMTLPLFTVILLRRYSGEAAIGQIYAANTLGAISGVLFAVHIGLPMLGVKALLISGALLDIGLGFVLIAWFAEKVLQRKKRLLTSVGLTAAVLATIGFAQLDPRLLSSGVFRYGTSDTYENAQSIFYKDGKTASVALNQQNDGMLVLITNGKADAAIQMDPSKQYTTDEITQTIVGPLAIAYKPDAKRIANIGFGSGMTAHALLASAEIEQLDTIEIEPAMVEAARLYGDHVSRVFDDPRSVIHIEDAKSYFSLANTLYDIIITEPSNPWVSGVASLFSTEFYRHTKRHIKDDGIFVQWIQLYEFTDDLVFSILKALSENFEDFVIYNSEEHNILIVAKKDGQLGNPDWTAIFDTPLAGELAKIDVNNRDDMLIRKIIGKKQVLPLLESQSVPANSDYFPFVDQNAGKARFAQSSSSMFSSWWRASLPLLEMLNGDAIDFENLTRTFQLFRVSQKSNATWLYRTFVNGESEETLAAEAYYPPGLLGIEAKWIRQQLNSCKDTTDAARMRESRHQVFEEALPFLSAELGGDLVGYLFAESCSGPVGVEESLWQRWYSAIAARNAEEMSTLGRELLEDDVEATATELRYVVRASILAALVLGRSGDVEQLQHKYSEILANRTGQPDLLVGAGIE